jgi:hypothetical protein
MAFGPVVLEVKANQEHVNKMITSLKKVVEGYEMVIKGFEDMKETMDDAAVIVGDMHQQQEEMGT